MGGDEVKKSISLAGTRKKCSLGGILSFLDWVMLGKSSQGLTNV